MKPEKSPNFDLNKMRALAEKMIADGTMPPPAQFLAAIERIKAEYAQKILKAREQDQMENSGVHQGLKTALEKPEKKQSENQIEKEAYTWGLISGPRLMARVLHRPVCLPLWRNDKLRHSMKDTGTATVPPTTEPKEEK